MAKVFKISENIEYRKAKKHSRKKAEKQLSLFSETGNIYKITESLSWFEYALILDERKDPGTIEAYLKAIEDDDCPADAYCNLGIIENSSGNNLKAFENFLKALKFDPSHFESHINLANLYFEEKDFNCALLHYKIAHSINSDFYHLHYNIGLCSLMLKNYAEALEHLITYKLINKDNKADELITLLKDYLK